MKGWQVPTYPLPKNMAGRVIQRIVVWADFGMSMAHDFIDDLTQAIHDLDQAHIVFHNDPQPKKYGFTH